MAYRYQSSYEAENQDYSYSSMGAVGGMGGMGAVGGMGSMGTMGAMGGMGNMGHNAHNSRLGCENGLGSSQMGGYSSYGNANSGYGLGNHHGQGYHHNRHGGGALASNYAMNQGGSFYSGNNSCDPCPRVIFYIEFIFKFHSIIITLNL